MKGSTSSYFVTIKQTEKVQLYYDDIFNLNLLPETV